MVCSLHGMGPTVTGQRMGRASRTATSLTVQPGASMSSVGSVVCKRCQGSDDNGPERPAKAAKCLAHVKRRLIRPCHTRPYVFAPHQPDSLCLCRLTSEAGVAQVKQEHAGEPVVEMCAIISILIQAYLCCCVHGARMDASCAACRVPALEQTT